MNEKEQAPPKDEPALQSWKEIAAYLKRDVRTAKRWEKSEGLPVYRHLHQARSTVYAYPGELDAWWARRRPAEEPVTSGWLERGPVRTLAFSATLLLTMMMAGGGMVVSPAASVQRPVHRLVWSGLEVDPLCAPSPDGRFLALTDWDSGDLAVRDMATGAIRRLTHNRRWEGFAEFPVFSPDAQHIAYSWFEKGTRHLRVFSLESSTARVVYSNDQIDYTQPYGWSPDGSQILTLLKRLDGTHQIAFIAAADGSARVLKTMDWRSPRVAALSRDGRYVLYDFPRRAESLERDIFLLATDGSRDAPLVEHPANELVLGWAPDGKTALFASDRTGRLGIWAVAVAEGQAESAPELVRSDVPPLWPKGITRDGTFYYGVPTGMIDVYRATLDPLTRAVVSGPAPVTPHSVGSNHAPDLSPDGQSLVYVSQLVFAPSSQRGKIILRSLETGEEREINPQLQNFGRRTRWSPDGGFLLVQGQDPAGRSGLFKVNLETGEATLVLREESPGYLQSPSWSSDGRSILYLRTTPEAANRLRRRNLETGEDRELLSRSTSNFALSHDGRRLVVRFDDEDERASVLAILPAEGGELTELIRLRAPEILPSWSGLAWTPDGKHILFTKAAGEGRDNPFELWQIPSEGGRPQKMGISMKMLQALRVHPDGKTIVFSAGLNTFEIWVMENFLPAPQAAR